jgi:hypothetical protein
MTDIEQFMNQHEHDVNQPIEVEMGARVAPIVTAIAKLKNRDSKIIHLSPAEARAILNDIQAMEDEADAMQDKIDKLRALAVAYGAQIAAYVDEDYE